MGHLAICYYYHALPSGAASVCLGRTSFHSKIPTAHSDTDGVPLIAICQELSSEPEKIRYGPAIVLINLKPFAVTDVFIFATAVYAGPFCGT